MKLKTKIISWLACMTFLCAITLVYIHYDYGYARYGYCEEDNVMVSVFAGYIIVTLIVAYFIGVRGKTNTDNTMSLQSDAQPESTKENSISADNVVEFFPSLIERNNDYDAQYKGTGVLGLTKYIKFCQIIGVSILVSGIVFLSASISADKIYTIIGLWLVIGGINCLIIIPFIKAIVTITKAAKIYIDKNTNKQKENEE